MKTGLPTDPMEPTFYRLKTAEQVKPIDQSSLNNDEVKLINRIGSLIKNSATKIIRALSKKKD